MIQWCRSTSSSRPRSTPSIWHYFREARGYHDVVVRCPTTPNSRPASKPSTAATTRTTRWKLGIGKSRPYIETFQGRLIDAKGVTARYVRVYSNGNTANDLNHYIEVEVFGKPVKK